MGEFNANRRKQGWNENTTNNKETGAIGRTDRRSANRSKSILRKQNCEPDAKDVNFWTKVFCNNNNNNCSNNNGNSSTSRNSQDNYPASRSPVPPSSTSSNDATNSKKLNHTTTATLLNSILSNIKDNRPKSNETSTAANRSPNSTVNMRELDDISLNNATNVSANENTQYPQMNDSVRKSTYNLITSIKSKNSETKRKTTSASGALQQHETEQTRNERLYESNGQRVSLSSDINFDLNEANDTFLRTLNELRLDYDDLSTNRSVEHRNSYSSKER